MADMDDLDLRTLALQGSQQSIFATLRDVEARQERTEAALRLLDGWLVGRELRQADPTTYEPWLGKHHNAFLAALDGATPAAADGDVGEDVRGHPGVADLAAFHRQLDAPQPAPAPPAGELYEHPENGLSEALSALRGEGWHQTADNLERWYATLPPALDADAAETLREAAVDLEEFADDHVREDTINRLRDLAARLRALAEAVAP